MRILIGIIAFIIWGGVCIQWYVCGIKELCNEKVEVVNKKADVELQTKDSIIDTPKKETVPLVVFSFSQTAIYFPFAKSESKIDENKIDSLKTIVAELRNTEAILLIYGNTDKIGSDENNYKLGEERAQWVKNQLISYGLSADKIEIKSYGESKPKNTNDTEAGRAKNRRVDIILKTK
ncbi:MAG: OmpA family protein [Chloroflexia bacterium]|nr:OmpA family protein [Chloroflexia bacterium]